MTVISTIGYNQTDMIRDIAELYCDGQIHLDPTYSKGVFYKDGKVKDPCFKFDIDPVVDGCEESDVVDLPLPDDFVSSVMFDPPFVGASRRDGKPGIIKTRFSYYPSIPLLWKFYRRAIQEIARVLRENGILIFKCQDSVESGKQYWSHIEVHRLATEAGFRAEDLFILLAKSRLMSPNMAKQRHARKFHSYFWVFRKVIQYRLLSK